MGILSIWIIAIAISIKSKRDVEEVSLFGITLISLIYLIFGTLGILGAGTVVSLAFTVVSLAYCAYELIKNTKDTIRKLTSIGSVSLIAFTVFFVLVYKGCGIYHADNLTYWGINLKYLYNTSTLRTIARNFACIHPEGLLVWDYYILKTWVGYTESLPLAFHGLVDVVLLMPFLKFANGRYKYLKALAIWILLLALPCAAYNGYSSLLGDVPLAFGYVYCIVALLNYTKTFNNLYFAQLMSGIYMMLSTKRGGIIVVACFLMCVSFVIFQKKCECENRKNSIVAIAILLIETIVINSMWIAKLDFVNCVTVVGAVIVGIFLAFVANNWKKIAAKDGFIACFVVLAIISVYVFVKCFLVTDAYTNRIVSNYFIYLLTYDSYFLGIPIVYVLALFTVIVYLYYAKFMLEKNDQLRVRVGIGIIISTCAFLFIYLVLYVKRIGPPNGDLGPYMPSFPRYMAPIVYSMVIYTYYIVLDRWADSKSYIVFMASLTSVLYISALVSIIFIKVEPVRFYGFEQAGIELTEEDNLLVVLGEIKSDSGIEWPGSFMYAMSPATTNDIFTMLKVNPKEDTIESWPTKEEFKQALKDGNINYIYIQHFTDEFQQLYCDMFPGLEDFHSGMVYKVVYVENDVQFQLQ